MSCLHPILVRDPKLGRTYQVPCGKCVDCLNRRKEEWTIRILKETEDYPTDSFFVTLTFSDENLHNYFHPDYGDFPDLINETSTPSLDKADIAKFVKRFRKEFDIRYYVCGEYGDKFRRPHYHAIIFSHAFGCLSPDTRIVVLRRLWNLGFVDLAKVSPASIRYVAKYSMKSVGSDFAGLQKPFAVMSRKPPIGYKLFDLEPDAFRHYGPRLYGPTGDSFPLPRLVKEKIMAKHPNSKVFVSWNAFYRFVSFKNQDLLYSRDKYYFSRLVRKQLADDERLQTFIDHSFESLFYGNKS